MLCALHNQKINDMTNKELQSHIKALGQWADGNKKRIAFAVCVEEKNDENFESWVLQYGSSLKLPYILRVSQRTARKYEILSARRAKQSRVRSE